MAKINSNIKKIFSGKKVLIGSTVTVGAAGATTATALPIVISNKNADKTKLNNAKKGCYNWHQLFNFRYSKSWWF